MKAFGGHSDALMKEQVRRNIFDVHRQTQGHSQLVTGGGTTAVKVVSSAFSHSFRSRRSSVYTYPRPILTVY